ncbi:MAG: rhomboid family intramembrane serine protease [Gloeocapsa sp. DLM2.Bin57]|nr:MAG: rhomboid family intramembrane serine protease [Gloeocapsa sp. DLM2.Bin57]
MVPIKDENPIKITPYITYALIIINISVFIYQLSLSEYQLQELFQNYAVIPRQLTATFEGELTYDSIPELATLITCQFLHGGFLHVGFNMLYLWIFGNNIEEELGHIKFLLFYLTCGALAALAQWFFASSSTIPSIGASGAIAGVMGAYILRFPTAEILLILPLGFIFIPLRIPAYAFLGFWFLQQAFNGILSLDANMNIGMEGGGIAYWAHAGGFIVGIILAPILGLFRRKP